MPTYYVSKSADNGYVVGNNGNAGTTKGAPWLTITKFYATAVDGDLGIVNGGAVGNQQTYAEAAVIHPTTSTTLYPDPNGAAPIWQNTNVGVDGWIFTAPTSKIITQGAIGSPQLIFDAQNVAASRCWVANAASSGVVLLNCTFNNWATEALYLQPGASGLVTALVQQCTFNGSGSAAAGVDAIIVTVIATDVVTIRSCTFAAGTIVKNNFSCIQSGTNAAAATINVDKCTFTYNLGGALTANGIYTGNLPATWNVTNNAFNGTITGTLNVWRGFYSGGTSTTQTYKSIGNTYTVNTTDNNTIFPIFTTTNGVADIENETITATANGTLTPLSAVNGIRRELATTGTSPLTLIKNNKLTLINATTPPEAGIGIWCGSNTNGGPPTGQNSLSNVIISGNTISGANHSILIGWIGGALVYTNKCINSDNYNIVLKDTQGPTNPNLVFANILDGRGGTLTGASILGKAAQGDKVFNNLILRDNQTLGIPVFLVYFDGAAGAQGPSGASVNPLIANNVCYWASGIPTLIAKAQDTSTAIFHANAYYAAAGPIGGTPFSYQGVSYSMATWLAQVEPDGYNPATDPLVNYAAGDYRILTSSPLYRGGIFCDWRATDRRGRPFWATPSVGAYEVTGGDLASVGTGV